MQENQSDIELGKIYETRTESVFDSIMGRVYVEFTEYALTMRVDCMNAGVALKGYLLRHFALRYRLQHLNLCMRKRNFLVWLLRLLHQKDVHSMLGYVSLTSNHKT